MNASCTRIPPRYEPQAQFRIIPFLLLLTSACCGAVVLFLFNPAQHSFYPFCPFHRATGLLCPGCGSLRALHQLLHGHFGTALRFNALLVASLPVAGFFLARFVARKLKNQAAPFMIPTIWLWWALGVMLVFGIVRNLPFGRSLWLAP
ncbi:MAG: hypothetical protein QOJ40_1089 [Verrucomicrobiota bacterium]